VRLSLLQIRTACQLGRRRPLLEFGDDDLYSVHRSPPASATPCGGDWGHPLYRPDPHHDRLCPLQPVVLGGDRHEHHLPRRTKGAEDNSDKGNATCSIAINAAIPAEVRRHCINVYRRTYDGLRERHQHLEQRAYGRVEHSTWSRIWNVIVQPTGLALLLGTSWCVHDRRSIVSVNTDCHQPKPIDAIDWLQWSFCGEHQRARRRGTYKQIPRIRVADCRRSAGREQYFMEGLTRKRQLQR